MGIGQAFRLSIKSIVSNRMRSFLTMLGMIIGVASVITLTGIMQGATDDTMSQFSELGTNNITVAITNTGSRHVEVDDMYNIVDENPTIFKAVTPNVNAGYTVKNGVNSVDTSVIGVGEDYLDINQLKMTTGRFIQYSDIKTRNNVCVIGTYIRDELYDGNVNIGDSIKINSQLYTVIGILEESGDSEQGSGDDRILIPYSNAARMANIADISSFTFSAIDTELVEAGEKILDDYIYSVMKDKDLFQISSLTQLLDMVEEMMGVLTGVLNGIAGISLLVAGIGIMNIMLVSVVERTKEIGIRKSLGAKKKDIMRQFVIEAAMISSIGGIIGIILGSIGSIQLGNLFKISAVPSAGSIILAFTVSATIGIAFGYMPANKAAKLNPIDALRSE
ncbi:putative ABC transport system permease protein [Mobilisporobacter senegalensis]|uniref:Putative ABC transport system permease protein n=1 Tax=Mobilisporobacter senegalensis TaxID=1329262 RepID=A0A3N1Y2C0_9FIRM|nr:ABC transporter permease [Mobilisporobacter senegalensis]ROR31407.1 putative ABC transport system permease protein [Mobilisporobacter senegalensis]